MADTHILDDDLAYGIEFIPLLDENTGKPIHKAVRRQPWEPDAQVMPFLTRDAYESPTRRAIRVAEEKRVLDAAAEQEAAREEERHQADLKKAHEQAEIVRAAVAEMLPTVKAQDEIIAAVVAKLAEKPPVSKGVRKIVHRDENNRITHVDEVPL